MTLREGIEKAIDERDARTAGWVSEMYRQLGLNYWQTFERVQRWRPDVEIGEWDDLLREFEDIEAAS